MFYLPGKREMQEIDRLTIEDKGIPGLLLMERAAISVLEEINANAAVGVRRRAAGGRISCLIAVTGGNNGGDGLALARLLRQQGDMVDVCLVGDMNRTTDSFSYQLDIVRQLDIGICDSIPDREYDVICDGIFGVGLSREVAGVWADVIGRLNLMSGLKIAIDVPSGIDAATGQILGTAFCADMTVTFGLDKLGLVLYPGCQNAGKVIVRDIGFADEEIKRSAPSAYSYDRADLSRLPKRCARSNKGTYGRVAVIAGSVNMSGAMAFAAEAAYRVGTGLVKVYTHEANRQTAGVMIPEAVLMTYTDEASAAACARDAAEWADVILIGPGIGRGDEARAMVKMILSAGEVPVVADADALNIISENTDILKDCRAKLVVTPHLGEMARLTEFSIPDIQADIISVCRSFADKYGVICVLKDARTCVASGGDEHIYVNTSGNNGMSTAGAGDVLAGIIAGLIGTGLPVGEAARLGVYIHGLAGDVAAAEKGKYGMMARDIIEAIPTVIKGAEHEQL